MPRTISFIECVVVLTLLAATATVAIPFWQSDQIVENEERAVEILTRICEAQDRFHARCGTYGFLEELAGARSGRRLTTLPASLVLGDPSGGLLERNGYIFTVYLPSAEGYGALHHAELDAETAARFWIAYAWPAHYGITGRRLFAVTSKGDVFAHENSVNPFAARARRPFASLAWKAIKEDDAPFKEPAAWVQHLRWNKVRAGVPD